MLLYNLHNKEKLNISFYVAIIKQKSYFNVARRRLTSFAMFLINNRSGCMHRRGSLAMRMQAR